VCPQAGNDDLPTDGRNAKRYICERMIALSRLMDDLDRNWAARWNPVNDFPGLFDGAHRFMVDVFPVYIAGSKSRRLSNLTYSGKYTANVVKVSITLDVSCSNTQ
jgi:hypothetical protein